MSEYNLKSNYDMSGMEQVKFLHFPHGEMSFRRRVLASGAISEAVFPQEGFYYRKGEIHDD